MTSVLARVASVALGVMAFATRTPAQSPPVPNGVVFRITFNTLAGPSADSGTAWLLKLDDTIVGVTAFHVLAGRAVEADSNFRSHSIDSIARNISLASFDVSGQ